MLPLKNNQTTILPQAGYYCVAKTAVLDTTNSCPAGYYCPSETKSMHEFPCPPGTYSDQTGNAKFN